MKTLGFIVTTFFFINTSLFCQPLPKTTEVIGLESSSNKLPHLENIEHTIDSLCQVYLNKDASVQGAVISIVSADSVLLSKGYGFADVTSKTPFHPEQTTVMVASVSKLLTTTAILQLIEQGEINLDQPVSELVTDIDIKNPYDQPVLIKHILTHTAGFDDTTIGTEAKSVDAIESLSEHLKNTLPPIVWEPGKYYNYSNKGMVLLAYIIETVSGMPFDQYLAKHLYTPLEMSNSGFSYKDASLKHMMTRYKWKEDDNDVLYLDDSYGIKYTNQTGAAGFQTTAKDMSHFMQMYLNKGVFRNAQVLELETIQNAFSPHFYYHQLMDRKQGLTWRVRQSKGVTYNYHSGDDTGIESIVTIFPSANLAYFFAANSNEANALKFEIRDVLIDKLKKEDTTPISKSFTSKTNLESLTGTYQYMNDGQSSIERLFSYLFGDTYKVSVENNSLTINGNLYHEVDALLFQSDKVKDLLVNFVVDTNGTHYSTGYATYRKLSFLEIPSLHVKLLVASFVIFLISIVLWTAKYLKTKNISRPRLYIGLAAFFLVAFFGLLAITTAGGTAKYGVPKMFYLVFALPLLAIILGIVGTFKAPKFLKSSSNSLFSKCHLALALTALVVCLIIYNHYNLIGYHF